MSHMETLAAQLYSPSLDLIMLVVAVLVDLFLAVAVYRSNPTSATNRIFSLLTVCTMLWLVVTYIVRLPELLPQSLFLHRLGIFFAAPMSALFFLLAHTMPAERVQLGRRMYLAIIVATLGMMATNLSPYAFVSISIINGVSQPQPGLGLLPFSILSTLFSLLTIYWLVRTYLRSTGGVRKQVGLVLSGILIMLALIIATILFPIIIHGSTRFLAFTPLYALAFLGMTAYAITEYQLFNIKVLVTQAATLVLGVVLFARLFGEATVNAQIIDGLVLVVVAIFGFFLVRSVKREVSQREKIQKLAEQLQITNERQEGLLHFIGHEVKGFLTKAEGALAALLDGDFGVLSGELRPFVSEALKETRNGVTSVSDILKAANQKKGTVEYTKAPFDLKALVVEAVEKARLTAEGKGLKLSLYTDESQTYILTGDKVQMADHVLRNLIDNALAYTPTGSINVSLERVRGDALGKEMFVIKVKDTGVGINETDRPLLFAEGGHGKESQKVNVHSTGYGLFIAKNVVEAHSGTIRVDSAGPGHGSMFVVELPV